MEKRERNSHLLIDIPLFCDRCGAEIHGGEGYYGLVGKRICRDCLPKVAEALLLPFLLVAGEEARTT